MEQDDAKFFPCTHLVYIQAIKKKKILLIFFVRHTCAFSFQTLTLNFFYAILLNLYIFLRFKLFIFLVIALLCLNCFYIFLILELSSCYVVKMFCYVRTCFLKCFMSFNLIYSK